MKMRWGMLAVALLCGCGAEMTSADAGPQTDASASPDTALTCSPGCSSFQLCCPGTTNRCVDHYSDPMNCGGCGVTCDAAAGELCINAACAVP